MSGRGSQAKRWIRFGGTDHDDTSQIRHPNMNWPVLFATASGRSRMRAPAAMPSRGGKSEARHHRQNAPGVGPRRHWKERLIVRHLMTPAIAAGIVAAILGHEAGLQGQTSSSPYRVNYNWDKPLGRKIGVASGIEMDPDGRHLWILDRCGANGCAESDLDPIIQVDCRRQVREELRQGRHQFSAWLLHRSRRQRLGHRRRAGRRPRGEAGFKKGMGHQVFKFSPDGKLLMRLGEAGVAGADEKHFNGPTGVVVAQNGDIWITDGHGGPQRDRTGRTCTGRAAATTGWSGSRRTGSSSRPGAAASAPRAAIRCGSTTRTTSRSMRKDGCTSPTAATSACRCSTRRATSSPAGRSSASRARSRSTPRAYLRRRRHVGRALESRVGARHPHRRSQDRLDQGVHPRRGVRPAPARSSLASIRRAPSIRAQAAGPARGARAVQAAGLTVVPGRPEGLHQKV